MRILALVVAFAASCQSEHVHIGGIDARPDAAITVKQVACPPMAPVISTMDAVFAFSPPSTTIAQGDTIQFLMSPDHAVASSEADVVDPADRWDPGLVVGFGDTKCLEFTSAGTFRFHCQAYNFRGVVVVE